LTLQVLRQAKRADMYLEWQLLLVLQKQLLLLPQPLRPLAAVAAAAAAVLPPSPSPLVWGQVTWAAQRFGR
jgi:hypothetical protein